MTSTQLNLDPGATKKYTPRDRLMRHQARDGCVKSPFKRIQSAWTQQCHIEGDSVDTIGALRPMGGIWASNNKSRASITLIIKFRDSPERGGHFEESPTEILQRMRFYKDRDSTKTEILQRTRFSRTRRALWRKPDRDSTPSEPSAPWGASGPAATSPGPPSPSSSSSPGLTPLLPSLQTHSIGSIGPGPCVSQDAQDAHQRPQRRGNKEVLELVLGSRWYPQPLNAANERQSSGDETRTSWDELRRGHHNMIWERS